MCLESEEMCMKIGGNNWVKNDNSDLIIRFGYGSYGRTERQDLVGTLGENMIGVDFRKNKRRGIGQRAEMAFLKDFAARF